MKQTKLKNGKKTGEKGLNIYNIYIYIYIYIYNDFQQFQTITSFGV